MRLTDQRVASPQAIQSALNVLTEYYPVDRFGNEIAHVIPAMVTAYQRAVSADVRAALSEYENAAIRYGAKGDSGDACPEFEAMDAALKKIVALLGVEDEE